MTLPSNSEVLPFPPLEPLPAHWSWALECEEQDQEEAEEHSSPIVQSRDWPPRSDHGELNLESQSRGDDGKTIYRERYSTSRKILSESPIYRSNRSRSEISSRLRNTHYSRPSSRCYAPRSHDLSSKVTEPVGEKTSLYSQRNRDGCHPRSSDNGKSMCKGSEICREPQGLKNSNDEKLYTETQRWRCRRNNGESYKAAKRHRHDRSPDVYESKNRTRSQGTCYEVIDYSEARAEKKINHGPDNEWTEKREQIGMKLSVFYHASKEQVTTSLDCLNVDDSLRMDEDMNVTKTSNVFAFSSSFCESTSTGDMDFVISNNMSHNDTVSVKDMSLVSENKPLSNNTNKGLIGESAKVVDLLKHRKIETANTAEHKVQCDEMKLTDRPKDINKNLTENTERCGDSNKKSTPRSKDDSTTFVDVTNKFHIRSAPVAKKQAQEDDPHRLGQRQRQIEFGKNTLGYERYCELISRQKRKRSDPQTPNPKQVCSKRSWDGQIRKWRRLLHAYDPPVEEGEETAEDFSNFYLKSSNTTENDNEGICEPEGKTNDGNQKVMMRDTSLEIYEDWMEL